MPAEQHFVFAVIDLAAVRFRFPELDDLLDKREVIVIRSVPQLQTAFRLLMTEIAKTAHCEILVCNSPLIISWWG
jgi:hypothetical protein